jgi:uncharacterized protein (DUF983 family)
VSGAGPRSRRRGPGAAGGLLRFRSVALRLFVRCVLRSRCPCCGEGAIFAGILRFRESCPRCGLVYEQWAGEWITPTYLASSVGMLVGLVWMAAVLVRDRGVPQLGAEVPIAAAAVASALLALRPAKAGWLAFLYWVGAVEVSARTRASLRWEDGSVQDPTEMARLRAADARARSIRTPSGFAFTTRRFVSLRSLLFPRPTRPSAPKPQGSPHHRAPGP